MHVARGFGTTQLPTSTVPTALIKLYLFIAFAMVYLGPRGGGSSLRPVLAMHDK